MKGVRLNIENGQVFGRLTIIREAKTRNNTRYFVCKCECGTIREFELRPLITGATKSCGCLNREIVGRMSEAKADPLRKHRLYKKWRSIKSRCSEKNNKKYYQKGTRVCDEWANDYHAFYYWSINNGYKEGLEIDRKKNELGYSPDNCRWVTKLKNANNKTNTIFIESFGELVSLKRACDNIGMIKHYHSIHSRMRRNCVSFDEAVSYYKQKELNGR